MKNPVFNVFKVDHKYIRNMSLRENGIVFEIFNTKLGTSIN